nr:unnamed protein product [Callosobruchus analis]
MDRLQDLASGPYTASIRPSGQGFLQDFFDQDTFDILDLNRKARRIVPFPDEIPVIRSVQKPIGEKKFKDLQNL